MGRTGQVLPPRAPRRPHVLRHGGDERVDDWFWLRERDDPEVRAYLEAENDYGEHALADLGDLRRTIYSEILGRIVETDATAPVRDGPWEYFRRTRVGLQYEVLCRQPAGAGAPDPDAVAGTPPGEEVLLDVNALADGSEYLSLGDVEPDPAGRLFAYTVDRDGSERHILRVRDLATGVDLDDEVSDVSYGVAWTGSADDDRGTALLFVRPDDSMRPWQVWRHRVGTPSAEDTLVYQEDDERFFVRVDRARSGGVIVIASESKQTSEVRLLDASAASGATEASGALHLVAEREQGVEYAVEHHPGPAGERLFILTNADGASNFKLVSTTVAATAREHWVDVVPHDPDVRILGVDAFAGHLVLTERADGLERLRVLALDPATGLPTASRIVATPDDVGSVWVGENREFATSSLRYGYSSLVVPPSAYDEDLDRGEPVLVKRQPVVDYDPADYVSAREWATAADGTRVPLSIVRRRDVALDGTAAAVLYGYGSYELSMDPTFSATRLSLLTRGVVYAIAHVRGGGEMGRTWYEEGRLDHKRNTFTDFVACAEHLVARGYAARDRLGARGGSAGGLLMGAVSNLAPDLFRAVVAQVPFVDVLTTMLDASLPLTVTEWEEWGDPATDPAIYEYLKSYSPYDNVRATDYPAMLVTAGFNDSRVQYWEPAKWVAKLRTLRTDDRVLVLRTELGAGHGGPSGRYDTWNEEALMLAFLLDELGVEDPSP